MLEMPPAKLVALAGCVQPVECVVTDDLEHDEARLDTLALSEQALVPEPDEPVEDGAADPADGFGRGERAAAGENAELDEETLHVQIEQVVGPVERPPEG